MASRISLPERFAFMSCLVLYSNINQTVPMDSTFRKPLKPSRRRLRSSLILPRQQRITMIFEENSFFSGWMLMDSFSLIALSISNGEIHEKFKNPISLSFVVVYLSRPCTFVFYSLFSKRETDTKSQLVFSTRSCPVSS